MIAWFLAMSYLLPAVAMMLGWGLRGFIGGGPLGAMIPGAMVALALCLTRGIAPSARACAFGAIAISFGGEMTYGQTVGMANALDTRAWGILGLSLKGAIWGLLGGGVLSLGFTRIAPKLLAQIGVVLTAATWFGWKLINHPKLIYFSNRLDRPREEVWAGFLLAGLVLILWQPHTRRFALWGALGGGIGFGLGGALQALGIQHFGRQYPWWKGMEFTFGLLFGLALGHAAKQLSPSDEPNPAPAPIWQQLLMATLLMALLFRDFLTFHLRFDSLLFGLIALWLVTLKPRAYWQLGLTVTVAATAFDLARVSKAPTHYAIAASVSFIFAIIVARYAHSAATALLLLTWSTTVIATAKFYVQGSGPENLVGVAFVVMAIAVTIMTRRIIGLPALNAP